MNNFCALKLDQNNVSKRTGIVTKHIAKMNNTLGGAKIDEILDRTHHANHDYERQKDNIYVYIDEEICGEFDWENKCVKDKNWASDKMLKEYIKSTPYYHDKDAYGRTHKLADDNIVCRELTFWYSPDQKDRMAPYVEEWADDNLDFVRKMYPHCKVVCAVVHMHESNPHMQIIIIPFDEKGKLNNYKYFYDDQDSPDRKSKKKATGKRTAQQLQTKYAELVGAKYGLERGVMGTEELISYEESKAEVALKKAKEKMKDAKLLERIADDKLDVKDRELASLTAEIQTIKTEGAKEIEKVKAESAEILERTKSMLDRKNNQEYQDYFETEKEKLKKRKEEVDAENKIEIQQYQQSKYLERIRLERVEDSKLNKQMNEKQKENELIFEEYVKEADKELESKKLAKDIDNRNELKKIEKEGFDSPETRKIREEIRMIEESERSYKDYLRRKGIETDLTKTITLDDYEALMNEAGKYWRIAYEAERFIDKIFGVLEKLGIYKPINNTISDKVNAFIDQAKERLIPIFNSGLEHLGLKDIDEFDMKKRPKTHSKSKDIDGLERNR